MIKYLCIVATLFAFNCQKSGGSGVKQIVYNTSSVSATVELDFCQKTPAADTRTVDQYRSEMFDFMTEHLTARLITLKWPQGDAANPISGSPITQTNLSEVIPVDCLSSQLVDESGLTALVGAAFNPQSGINRAVEKYNSPEIFVLSYPSFVQVETSCQKPPADLLRKFENQKIGDLQTAMAGLCQETDKIDDFAINPTVVSAFLMEEPNNTTANKAGYCTLIQQQENRRKQTQKWDDIEPWLFGGLGFVGGMVANIFSGFTAGLVVDAGIFAAALGEHVIRRQYIIQHLDYLKSIEEQITISDTCSVEQVSQDSAQLKDLIIWDSIGYVSGFAIGWAAPGVGRLISTMFKKGKAILVPISGHMYVAFPSIEKYFMLPTSKYSANPLYFFLIN